MPDVRRPNVDAHLYQDRDGRWRARLRFTRDDAEVQIYVPDAECAGFDFRMQLLLAIDERLARER